MQCCCVFAIRLILAGCFAGVIGLAQEAARADAAALNGLDPVLLTRGEEKAGLENFSAKRGDYSYRFSSSETLAEFQRSPDRYEIQMDGACARMGAASGAGSPQRWAVYDGRIYIFASDSCKRGFLTNPAGHLELVERPRPSDAKAMRWLEDAAKAHGLPAKSVWSAYEERFSRKVADGTAIHTLQVRRQEEAGALELTMLVDYPKWGVYGDRVTAAGAGVYLDRGKEFPHRPSQQAATLRQLSQHPVVILAARKLPGFQAWMERAPASQTQFETVGVFYGGGVTRLKIDRKTKRVAGILFQGRGPQSIVGTVEDTYADYRSADGGSLLVPFERKSTFNGAAWDGRSRTLERASLGPK